MGRRMYINKKCWGWFILVILIFGSLFGLGVLSSAFCSPLNFCWDEASGDVELYRVEVTDQFGQIVISTTTVNNCFSFDYEGALAMSVTAISSQGELGPYSEWSDMEMSTTYKEMVMGTADNLEIPRLKLIGAWVEEAVKTWEDPHEVP